MTVLPEGLQPQASVLLLLGRSACVLWAAFLLLAGRKFPRCTTGTLFLALGIALGFGYFSGTSYALALLVAWTTFGAGMLVHAFAPRIAMAAGCAWPLAAAYLACLYSTGSIEMNGLLALGLALSGAAIGAVFPKFGLAILAPALGATLMALAIPGATSFWWPAGLFAGGVLWQTCLLPVLTKPRFPGFHPPAPSLGEKRRGWRRSLAWGAVVLVTLAAAVALLVPSPDRGAAPVPGRLETLGKEGALRRPALLFSPEDSYYVLGRPMPIALLGPWNGPMNRLALPFLGHGIGPAVGKLRAVKDEGELLKMRRAADITSKAFEDVASLVKPGVNEADLEKAILGSFQRNGATGIAFRCVVGSGKNATLPHYMANSAPMREGLVVIDIGCTVDQYASDMTRTFPVSGTLTAAQRKLLETVIAAGDAARAILKPGTKMSELDQAARTVINRAGFGDYFVHGIGHPVGLEVHDSPIRGPVAPGNVITLEPGIYIPAGSKADKEFWDLGVRIEDSYLITKDGYEEITHFAKVPPER